jgi:hypothetical protein
MSMSDYVEQMVADALMGAGSFTKPTNSYFGLHTGLPGDTGANEASGGGYARALKTNNGTTWTAWAASLKTNAIDIDTFPELTGALNGVMAVSVWDAVTTGNLIAWCLLWSGVVSATGKASNDTITAPGHTFVNDQAVRLLAIENGGAIPTGLTSGNKAYIINQSGNDFKLSNTFQGTAIDITADGVLLIGLDKSKDIAAGTTPRIAAGQLQFYTV